MIKQVIVMRKDLNMRRGKEIAQGAHASICFLSLKARSGASLTEVEKEWIDGSFTKVCVRVESEQELLDIKKRADDMGLQCHLITDAGRTEFNGVPTHTCLAIGPDEAENIDFVTGNLKLY